MPKFSQYLLVFLIGFLLVLQYSSDICGKIQCSYKNALNKVKNSEKSIEKPRIGYISARLGTSRLANNIFEIVSLYGISKYLNRQPIIYLKSEKYIEIVEKMRILMPELMNKFEYRETENLTEVTQIEFNKKCCIFENPKVLKLYRGEHIHLNGNYYQSYKYFEAYRTEIRSFVTNVEKSSASGLPASSSNNFIFCVHSRRTDFVDGQHHSTDKDFVISARNFIIERENRTDIITVIMGDDFAFEASIFGNETDVFVSAGTPIDDLIYSRYSCDATLHTAPSSTFGWWVSYLSKGERVYYMDIKTTTDVNYMKGELIPTDFFDPRWTPIKFDKIYKKVSLS